MPCFGQFLNLNVMSFSDTDVPDSRLELPLRTSVWSGGRTKLPGETAACEFHHSGFSLDQQDTEEFVV